VTHVRFEVRGAVRDLFHSQAPAVLLSGAAGTGKTYGALMLTHLNALSYPGSRHLLLRKTLASLSASTLVTWRKGVIKEALAEGLVSFYGGSSQEPAAFRYANGSTVVVGGLDKATKLLSTEYDTAFVDEAIEVTPEDLDTLETRFRNGVMPYQQLRMCTNPGPPTHHLKQRCDDGRVRMLYSQHEDNPRMWDGRSWTPYGATYLERLDSLTGVRYERMRWGKWVAAEGLIYEDWSEPVHYIEPFPIPKEWPRYVAMDFGFSNPQVIQWWAKDPDGRLYLYREIYRTRRTVDQHAKAFLKQVTDTGTKDGTWLEPKPRAVIADHDAEGRVVFERETGLQTRAADKRVKLGIESFQRRLRTAGDGKPRLYIMRNALCHTPDRVLRDAKKPTCTAEEVTGYVWDVKHGEQQEQPVKEDDHGMDAGRYLVMHIDPPSRGRSKLHLPAALGSLR
jgi:PBSX family phage terminase large subunit